MDDSSTAEHRLTDLIDRWKIDAYPAADLLPALDAMPAFLADLDAALRVLRQTRTALNETIDERDRAQDAADKLAYAIAPVEMIGEHGEGDPWAEALEALAGQKIEHDRLAEENAALRRALFVAPAAAPPARVFTGHDDDWGMPLFLALADAKSYAEMEFEARFPEYAAEFGDGEPIGWTERQSRTEHVGYPDMWDMSGGGANYVLCGVTVHPSLASALAEHPIEKTEPEPKKQIKGQGVLPVETPRGYRVGDLVQITERGVHFDGKTGVVVELDGDPEYPIGLDVDGFVGRVWCNSGEIRHADVAQDVPVETAGSAL